MPQIAVFIDNMTMNPHLACEHGLSMGIILDSGELWIWDTGQTGLFMGNAMAMGIHPGRATGVVLSHGHYDHTGGLNRLWEQADFQGPIYGHPMIFARRFASHGETPPRAIGLRTNAPRRLTKQFISVENRMELAPGLTMYTNITRQPGHYEPIQGFYLDQEATQPDTIPDDACLVLESPNGPILVLGCCHSGLANTCEHIAECHGIDRFHSLIGGLHLGRASDEAIEETCRTIKRFGFESVFAGHCTGETALPSLQKSLPDIVHPMGSGLFVKL
ncbi:MBL fold metallo-hydrolase [Desulfoplanes formicivorans]|uniref:Beta-lactamase n=1 Tax=Desulfoplanes formicivorans TaxID=1592317 RepID=A0A194AIQ1_9BACT|nr:MBL fold metallo-hydrolase [Desulfoplanes formicivorans]GAU08951.1 beta-lactamase [Desulfoplanes formicivorans]